MFPTEPALSDRTRNERPPQALPSPGLLQGSSASVAGGSLGTAVVLGQGEASHFWIPSSVRPERADSRGRRPGGWWESSAGPSELRFFFTQKKAWSVRRFWCFWGQLNPSQHWAGLVLNHSQFKDRDIENRAGVCLEHNLCPVPFCTFHLCSSTGDSSTAAHVLGLRTAAATSWRGREGREGKLGGSRGALGCAAICAVRGWKKEEGVAVHVRGPGLSCPRGLVQAWVEIGEDCFCCAEPIFFSEGRDSIKTSHKP